jgi:hypothetical protein
LDLGRQGICGSPLGMVSSSCGARTGSGESGELFAWDATKSLDFLLRRPDAPTNFANPRPIHCQSSAGFVVGAWNGSLLFSPWGNFDHLVAWANGAASEIKPEFKQQFLCATGLCPKPWPFWLHPWYVATLPVGTGLVRDLARWCTVSYQSECPVECSSAAQSGRRHKEPTRRTNEKGERKKRLPYGREGVD